MAANSSEDDRLRAAALQNARAILAARTRAEEELQKQSDWLRATLASIGDGVISTDIEGRITFMNAVAQTLTGWTEADAVGQPLEEIFKIFDESTRSPVTNPALRTVAEGTIVGLANHTILIAKDSTEWPIDDSAAPIRDSSGTILGSVLVFREIVERKRLEAAVQKAHSRLEATLAASEVGSWEFDPLSGRVHADRNFARMFGVTPEEAERGDLDIYMRAIYPEDRSEFQITIGKMLQSGNHFESEFRLLSSAGGIRFCIARGHVELGSDGKAARFSGIIVDISSQRRVEAALRASEERRLLALEGAELGAWNVDPASSTLVTDERFQVIFSGAAGPIDYQKAFALLHPEDRDRVRDAMAASVRIDDPAPFAEEYRVIHPEGSVVRWILARGRANFEGEGAARRAVSFDGTVADVTERKRMEDELRRVAAELYETDRRKNEFLAMLAHELRNPLAPMSNALQIVQLSVDNPVQVRAASEMLDRHMQHLVRIVEDLLDVSRIAEGKIDLRLERVELSVVINRALETSRVSIESGMPHLKVEIPQEPIYLQGDTVRLTQVFSNLLNNAGKYTNPGGSIVLSAQLQGSDVVVSIKDTGVGIPAEMLPKVFEMFTQLDRSLERSQGGLGIGLSLVRTLVSLHGGSVEALSEGNGLGSEFVVRLPAVLEPAKPAMAAPARKTASSASRRILVVDDNQDSADSLALLLKLTGHEAEVAYDGVAAIAAAEKSRPDMVLLDIGLPKLNGYEAARHIRQQPWGRKMVLVALTGWGQDEDRRKSKAAGFDIHLVKPVDAAALEKLLS